MAQLIHDNFALDVPKGWMDSSVVTLLEPEGGRFRHSLVVTHAVLTTDTSLPDYVDEQIKTLKESLTDFHLEKEETVPRLRPDEEARQILYHWRHEGERTLRQWQFYLKRSADVLTLTATALDDTFERYRPLFESVVRSLHFIEPETSTQISR